MCRQPITYRASSLDTGGLGLQTLSLGVDGSFKDPCPSFVFYNSLYCCCSLHTESLKTHQLCHDYDGY